MSRFPAPADPSAAHVQHGFPALDSLRAPAADLAGFVPPPRFGEVGFEDYRPHHESQRAAAERVAAFAREASRPPARRWFWRARDAGRGLYLDGGFGVGKTHLLAAAWHAAELPADRKRYLSFQELVYTLGVLGRAGGQAAFEGARLLCIDEFELDDPGNTLIVATFLRERFAAGAHVLTTSNTPPASQGAGRFAADDFRREIQGIADRFEVVRVDGPDHRAAERRASFPDADALARAEATAAGPVVRVSGEELLGALTELHPVRYRALLAPVGTLLVEDLERVRDQATALRFVHFVDKLYDLGVGFRASADFAPHELFVGEWRHGAYVKKHDRCLSRLSELLQEPVTAPNAEGSTG